jgi:ABC-type multidrug transport system ATPase subunit
LTDIVADGLVKRLGSRLVLDHVDLHVPTGALWGLVGADGAGKTTLLRCLAGLYGPDAGRVEPGRAHQDLIGFAQQGFHLYPDLTVDENVAFLGRVYGLRDDRLAERAGLLLGFAGLTSERTRLAGWLSGGMKQKLSLACALLHEPEVLLLDEPTTGVDPVSRLEFWDLVEHLHASGATILLASAYFDEVERCEHVVYLHHGRVLASGNPDDLRGGHARLEEAFLERTT